MGQPKNEKIGDWILKVLVGSRAHGLHTETSDYDYRGVFVQPTSEILSLHGTVRQTSWIEGRPIDQAGAKEDDTAWEIGHFLKLAMHCNPTILEVFAAPMNGGTPEGEALQNLFPYIWDPKKVRDAFVGYGLNQRKKMLEGKDTRPQKYATAYLRTLIQAEVLLRQGVLLVNFEHHEEFQTLLLFRNRMTSAGQVIDKCQEWEFRIGEALEDCRQVQDLEPVNQFLLDIRRAHWS